MHLYCIDVLCCCYYYCYYCGDNAVIPNPELR